MILLPRLIHIDIIIDFLNRVSSTGTILLMNAVETIATVSSPSSPSPSPSPFIIIDTIATRSPFHNVVYRSDGQVWRHQRKTASHLFTSRNLRDHMFMVLKDNLAPLCSVLSEAQNTGEFVDLQKIFHNYTLDSFCEIAYGIKVGTTSAVFSFEGKDSEDDAGKAVGNLGDGYGCRSVLGDGDGDGDGDAGKTEISADALL